MLCLLFIIILFNNSNGYETDNDVFILTDRNFDDFQIENSLTLINFYAPWCSFSQRLKPKFIEAAQILKQEKPDVKLGFVDVISEIQLKNRFNITRFPTVILFDVIKNRQFKYGKGHEARIITNWVISKTDNLIVKAKTTAEIEKLKEMHDVLVLTSEDDIEQVLKAVDKLDDIQLVSVPEELYVMKYPNSVITLFRKEDSAKLTYNGDIKSSDVERFVYLNRMPLVNMYTKENANILMGNPMKNMHFFVITDDDFDKIKKTLTKVAGKFETVSFIILDKAESFTNNIIEYFGLKDRKEKTMMVLGRPKTNSRFIPTFKEVDLEKIEEFVRGVVTEQIKPHTKSQEQPSDWNKQPVKVLVTNNFDEVVYDKSKNVFVEFYAPWCGHCKKLAPIWDKLAKKWESVPDLVIAKIDMTANDIESFKVTSFPTMKLILKDTNEVVDYKGSRHLVMFEDFLSKYVSKPQEKTEL